MQTTQRNTFIIPYILRRNPEGQTAARRAFTCSIGAVLAIAAAALPACASVIVSATASQNITGNSEQWAYNYGPLGPGYHTSGGCSSNAGPPATTCGLTTSGTMDASTTDTSAFESVVMTGSVAAYPPLSLPAASDTGNAYATASMLSASVGVAAGGNYLDYRSPSSGQAGASGSAFAQTNDTLNFIVGGANSSTVTDITVSFTVDGLMTVNTPAGDSTGSLEAIIALGGASITDFINASSNTGQDPVAYTPYLIAPSGSGWVSFNVTPTGPVAAPSQFVMTGVYAITGTSASLGIAGTLSAQCALGTSCDYSHTGTISLGLPGNVSYTSASGVFLTQSTATPEPGSIVLALIGLALFACGRNNLAKRRSVAVR